MNTKMIFIGISIVFLTGCVTTEQYSRGFRERASHSSNEENADPENNPSYLFLEKNLMENVDRINELTEITANLNYEIQALRDQLAECQAQIADLQTLNRELSMRLDTTYRIMDSDVNQLFQNDAFLKSINEVILRQEQKEIEERRIENP